MKHDDFIRAFLVPAASSLFTGTLVILVALAGCLALTLPPSLALLAGAAAALITWLGFRERWMHIIEGYLNPQPMVVQPDPIRVQLVQDHDGFQEGQFIDLPVTPEQLHQLAQGLAAGTPFSLAAWSGQGKTFSRNEYETVRAELLKRGLARWSNARARQQGLELTPAGRAVFKHLVAPPLPAMEDREDREF